MFLLDTDVVSLLRRPDRHPAPAMWLQGQRPTDVFISVVTLAEMERGLAQQRRRDPEFARDLETWMERTTDSFADRIIGVDPAAARLWGRMSGDIGHFNVDLLIAATALVHGLTVVTRNVRHFEPTGVRVVNPFGDGGDSGASPEGA
ncbi:MAG: type II toxin-antitoxin system VapC family toxin [Chloroflexota bacterium]|nr:type II toxin-antitoxin system VapC family toxin [Chloroflexota bacterium]